MAWIDEANEKDDPFPEEDNNVDWDMDDDERAVQENVQRRKRAPNNGANASKKRSARKSRSTSKAKANRKGDPAAAANKPGKGRPTRKKNKKTTKRRGVEVVIDASSSSDDESESERKERVAKMRAKWRKTLVSSEEDRSGGEESC